MLRQSRVTEQKPPPAKNNAPKNNVPSELSPIRPSAPQPPAPATSVPQTGNLPQQTSVPQTGELTPEATPNPYVALKVLHNKMARITQEFSHGTINRAQYDAMAQRYSEQQAIIQRLIERDPDGKAWKQVLGVAGQTGFLRQHFEAQAIYFAVYHHELKTRIYASGRRKPDEALIKPILKQLWSMESRPQRGIGRKQVSESQWLMLAVGQYSVTVTLFSLEPSAEQIDLTRDLHADFERANAAALARGIIAPERMVFPQRALVENRP